jgi:hypothetical protein
VRQSGLVDAWSQPVSVPGRQLPQRPASQYGFCSWLVHSVSPGAPCAQARHWVVALSQIGVVGEVQSVAALAQPPQAPLETQARLPGQLSGLAVQRSQARELGLQIGVLPPQPALSVGLQSAQLPPTHCDLPSGRPWQSLES